MVETGELAALVGDRRRNALFGWALVAFVVAVAGGAVLQGDPLWAGFALTVAVLALVPAGAFRDPSAMLPWEVLALAALPLLGRSLGLAGLSGRLATYLSVAALALIVAVELDVFTTVKMTYWFAVLFVVVATMATAGVWAVVRWVSDLWLGTTFVLEPGVPEAEREARVMWEFVYSTLAGLLAGVVFEWYFRRRAGGKQRLPDDVQEVVE